MCEQRIKSSWVFLEWIKSFKSIPTLWNSTTTSREEGYPLLQIPVKSPGYYQCFWLTAYKSKGPTTSSSDSMNLLEWLIQRQKKKKKKTCLLTRLSAFNLVTILLSLIILQRILLSLLINSQMKRMYLGWDPEGSRTQEHLSPWN